MQDETISLYPMKESLAIKVAKEVEKHGGKPLYRLRAKETTLLVYQPYAEDLVTIQKAKIKGIKTMTLGEFNRYLLDI